MHQVVVERASERYKATVDEANAKLTEIYQGLIAKYEKTGDAATAESLKKALEAILAGELKFEAPMHKALIRMPGPTLVTADQQPLKTETLSEVQHVMLYFSASWCGPCRRFTPKLVEFFNQVKDTRKVMVVFVSSDRSERDMYKYMKDDAMAWPAMPFNRIKPSGVLDTYGGQGIPNLVLLNSDGSVRSGSYVDGQYVGPTKVLDDPRNILKEESANTIATI
jgi:nucleoredoxin